MSGVEGLVAVSPVTCPKCGTCCLESEVLQNYRKNSKDHSGLHQLSKASVCQKLRFHEMAMKCFAKMADHGNQHSHSLSKDRTSHPQVEKQQKPLQVQIETFACEQVDSWFQVSVRPKSPVLNVCSGVSMDIQALAFGNFRNEVIRNCPMLRSSVWVLSVRVCPPSPWFQSIGSHA